MKAKNPRLLLSGLAWFLLTWLASPVFAQDRKPSIFETVTAEEAAKVTLETDYTALLANRKKNDYLPGKITLANGLVYEVEVRPRGKYRRKVCEVPPLKIKFSKKTLRSQGLDTLNDLKLVMPCFDNDEGDELIVKEYLAYRMFEHMTSACVRARLIKLTLIDSHVEKKRTMLAMLVEDDDETAARLNGTMVSEYGLPMDNMITNQAALVSMFEYMVGNTDWDVSMLRNVRLIKSHTGGKILVVPYDFDFSGLVSAPYASPSSESGLRNVRERFLMSNGLSTEHLRRATQQLRTAQKEFNSICRSKHLSRESSTQMIKYLDSFFLQAEQGQDMPVTMKAPSLD